MRIAIIQFADGRDADVDLTNIAALAADAGGGSWCFPRAR